MQQMCERDTVKQLRLSVIFIKIKGRKENHLIRKKLNCFWTLFFSDLFHCEGHRDPDNFASIMNGEN